MRKGEEFGDMFRQGNEQTEARERYFSEMKTHYEHQLTKLSHKAQVDLAVLQCVAVWCSVVQCVAVCCSVLQCVAVCYSVMLLQYTASHCYTLQHTWGSSHEFIQLIIIYARAPTLVAPAVAVVVEVWCVLMHVPFELLSVNVSVYHLLGTYIYTHTSSPFDPRIPTHNHTNTE